MNNRNCWHDRSCKLCKGRKIDLYSASWEQWDVWASPHRSLAGRDRGKCRVAAAIVQDPCHEDTLLGSPTEKSYAKVWHPIARIGEKTEFEAFALDRVSQLCVLRRSQWYESGYSSGDGVCVPGCVHAYPSSRGSIHETCQPAHNMQFLHLRSHYTCSVVTHSSPV